MGTIKILNTEPVQDGVERFIFAAGPAAIETTQDIEGTTAVVRRIDADADADELRTTANALVEEGKVAVIGSGAGGSAQVVVSVPEEEGIEVGVVISELARKVGGGGGGPLDFAQGGGPDVDAIKEAPEMRREKKAA